MERTVSRKGGWRERYRQKLLMERLALIPLKRKKKCKRCESVIEKEERYCEWCLNELGIL